jgi:calcium signal-modulating cyclophilin ligand
METPSEIDKQAARREARRQKILNNSNSRIGKITGRTVEEPEPELLTLTESQQVAEEFLFEGLPTSTFPTTTKDTNEELLELPEAPTNKFLTRKYHIILMALLTFVIFSIDLDYIVQSNIFLPILTYKVVEFFTPLRAYKAPPSKNLLLTFVNLYLQSSANPLMTYVPNVLDAVGDLLADTMLFTFVFVNAFVVHALLTRSDSISTILMLT